MAAEIKSFGFAGLKEEKHIEAVPLDREGKINPEFHREIFLGNHENFETQIQNNEKKRKEKLTEIFHKFEENCWFFVSDLENVLELTSISRILCRKTNCSILFTKTFRSIYKRPKTKTVNCSSWSTLIKTVRIGNQKHFQTSRESTENWTNVFLFEKRLSLFSDRQFHFSGDRNELRIFLFLGKITWHEYLLLYVKFHHVNITNITEIDNLENSNNPTDAKRKSKFEFFLRRTRKSKLNLVQRELIKIRYRWVSSDRNGDNDLDIDEFLAFRHPEIGSNSFGYVVEDLMLQLGSFLQARDFNSSKAFFYKFRSQRRSETKRKRICICASFVNRIFFEKNFGEVCFCLSAQNAESELHEDFEELNKRWLNEQKNEFREMDTDNDGKLTREELLVREKRSSGRISSEIVLFVSASLRSVESWTRKEKCQFFIRLGRHESERRPSFTRRNHSKCSDFHWSSNFRRWESFARRNLVSTRRTLSLRG